ncbi:tail assembly chaperone E/41/14-like protein [Rhizobium subbaraonis]|uniref:Tail assembly chaperone E/41/14-like protein n=1 Tax=Rhizobium subbaraonis TaxID=908946 RepID=A0A285V0S9_9HYPH|nr:phage tail assembly protein [Rhizobium subbaraonis]SOC47672.1 tail assembly chaperone E/41/14-like protein [Rhizobium subbaraonis]
MLWKTQAHPLKHPITIGDKTYAAVMLREPDADALEAIDDLGMKEGERARIGQLKGLLCALADVPGEVIGKLHRDDFIALQEIAIPLLHPSEGSGAV